MTGPADNDTKIVDHSPVACDGNGPGFGHPRVYLAFNGEHEIMCPYCSRRFVLAEGAKVGHGH
ncbi:MAG: zinc-finger domain-containing protein [Solirubrobacterales bacterium]